MNKIVMKTAIMHVHLLSLDNVGIFGFELIILFLSLIGSSIEFGHISIFTYKEKPKCF